MGRRPPIIDPIMYPIIKGMNIEPPLDD